jgi:hypothetical protein
MSSSVAVAVAVVGAIVEIAQRLEVPAPFSRAVLSLARLLSA